jgi:hypothetical protein
VSSATRASGATDRLDIAACFATAWRSFRKWWIPICLVAGLIVVFNILPRVLAWDEIRALRAGGERMLIASASGDIFEMESAAYELQRQMNDFALAFVRLLPLILPLTAILTIVLLLYASRAVAGGRKTVRLPIGMVIYTALLHFALALLKALAFLCCVWPGVYLYIKLYFVPLIMLEQNCGPIKAAKRSWAMTRGSFWPLLAIVFVNGSIQILALPSIIGAIPATGYANTVRAAAYRSLCVNKFSLRPPVLSTA